MIPESFTQDLLARADIVDVVSPHVALKKTGGRYIGLCPFHDEKTPSFNVIPSKQFFHCFGCGHNGDAIGFLMLHLGLKYPEAIKQLAASAGMQIPDRPVSAEDRKVIRKRIDAEALLMTLERDLTIVVLIASDYRQGRPVSDEDRGRYLEAVSTIMSAIEFAKGRPLSQHERRQLRDSELRPEEKQQLKEFAHA
jgi:DNA primase catalytic core